MGLLKMLRLPNYYLPTECDDDPCMVTPMLEGLNVIILELLPHGDMVQDR